MLRRDREQVDCLNSGLRLLCGRDSTEGVSRKKNTSSRGKFEDLGQLRPQFPDAAMRYMKPRWLAKQLIDVSIYNPFAGMKQENRISSI